MIYFFPQTVKTKEDVAAINVVIDNAKALVSGLGAARLYSTVWQSHKMYILSNLQYKSHLSGQQTCWSLRCSWSIACWRCSWLHLHHRLNTWLQYRLHNDNRKARRETFNLWDLMRLVLEIWVNIGSGNGLLPEGSKPLPEPMLTDRQWSPVTFILGQFD